MSESKIPYLDHVYNVITGCQGKGCVVRETCYAREMVRRFPVIHNEITIRQDYDQDTPLPMGRPFEQVVFHPDRLSEPLKRRKPTVYGVGFFGDWMDEQVKPEWLDDIMATMFQADWHVFVTLTKQSKNLVERLNEYHPQRHIFNGITVCSQADLWRVEESLKMPGKKWLSIEPMLGPVEVAPYLRLCSHCGESAYDAEADEEGNLACWHCGKEYAADGFGWDGEPWTKPISAVILGGESGPHARPMHPQWARSIVSQCKSAGVPLYVKQMHINGKLSHNPTEWPEEFRVRELPWRNEHAYCGGN